MALENVAPSPEAAPEPITQVSVPEGTESKISVSEAARLLRSARKPKEEPAPAPEAVETQPEESAPEANDTAEAPPSVEPEAEIEALPPIDPPRFWTADQQERFKTLPRETQEYLAERERERSAEVDRVQRESAEKSKALEAETEAARQQRQQYEQALPVLLQTLVGQGGEFADIKSIPDVQKMANDDPLRYVRWQAWRDQVNAVQQEIVNSQQRQEQEQSTQWASFAQREDAKFAELVPEIADPVKGNELRNGAIKVLKDVGFSDEELQRAWANPNSLSLRDHRLQRLIVDAVKFRNAKAVKPAKPVPPVVQRPGVAASRKASADDRIKALQERAYQTGNAKDMAALLNAQRAMRRA